MKDRRMLGILLVLLFLCWGAMGRRGRGRARTKSRVQIGLPITGKYRDPESDQYYNNNNGAKILEASHFDYEYMLGHKIAFVCVARGSPRPYITWFKDGVELYAHSYLHVPQTQTMNYWHDIPIGSKAYQTATASSASIHTRHHGWNAVMGVVHEWRIGPDKIKSKLEIDPATQMDAGVYECSADNMYSVDRRSFKTDFSIAFD